MGETREAGLVAAVKAVAARMTEADDLDEILDLQNEIEALLDGSNLVISGDVQ